MTQARRQRRLRTLAQQYDLGYALAVLLGVAAFVAAIMIYFDLL